MFFYTGKNDKVHCIPILESTYPEMQRKHIPTSTTFLVEYLNINHQPVATQFIIDIRHQPDKVLVDV